MVIGAPGSLDYDATLQPAACSSVANTPSPKKKSLRPLNGSGKHKPLNTVATSSPSFNLLSGHPSSPMHGDFPGPSDMVVPGMHSSGGCSDHHDHRDHSSRGSARDHRSRSSHSSPDAHDPGAHSPSLVDPLQHELFVQDPNNAIHMNHRGHISEKQHQWELKHHVHYHHLDQSEMEQKLPDIVFPAAKTTHTKGVYLALFPSKSSASRSRSRSRSRSPSQSRAQSRSGSPVVSKSRSESPGLLQWHPDNTTSSEDHSNMQALDSLPPTVALTAESLARHHDATSKGCSRAGSRRNSKTADGSHTKLNTSHDNCVSPCGSTITSHTLSSTNTGLTHPEYEDKRHRKKMEKLLQDEMVEHFLHDACYDDGQLAILDADSLEDVAARMHAHKEANENVHLNHVKIANTYDELLEEAVAVIGSADTIADASTVRRANNSGALLDPDQLEMYMETTAKMAIYRGRKLISGCAKFRERPITNIEKKLYKRLVVSVVS